MRRFVFLLVLLHLVLPAAIEARSREEAVRGAEGKALPAGGRPGGRPAGRRAGGLGRRGGGFRGAAQGRRRSLALRQLAAQRREDPALAAADRLARGPLAEPRLRPPGAAAGRPADLRFARRRPPPRRGHPGEVVGESVVDRAALRRRDGDRAFAAARPARRARAAPVAGAPRLRRLRPAGRRQGRRLPPRPRLRRSRRMALRRRRGGSRHGRRHPLLHRLLGQQHRARPPARSS